MLFLENRIRSERAKGCGGKNANEIEEKMRRRRKDGEETDRLASYNSSDCSKAGRGSYHVERITEES